MASNGKQIEASHNKSSFESWNSRRNQEKKYLNFLHYYRKREIQETDWRTFTHKVQVDHTMIENLKLHKALEGHSGCVNCIEFNDEGNLLLSGSDDFSIILWDVHKRKKLRTITTGHRGNIFSVKFLPQTVDNTIVSGAADYRIEVREIQSGDVTQVCTCHSERVKRIATISSVPHLFFSASEDGTVMQFDTRKKHTCSFEPNNVLINLRQHAGRTAECKCLAVHPLRPELIAVGSSDPFIRVYDRRMIKLTSIQYPPGGAGRSTWGSHYDTTLKDNATDNLSPGCVQYYVPGHLPAKLKDYYKRYRSLATTYLSYSSDGTKLMANLGGDHIYLFDTRDAEVPRQYSPPVKKTTEELQKVCIVSQSNGICKIPETNGYQNHLSFATEEAKPKPSSHVVRSNTETLPSRIEELRLQGNQAYASEDYTSALELFNLAISLYHKSPTLYSARAASRIKRGWDGDVYAALKDCDRAIALDPLNEKARFRQVKCLHLLKRDEEAKQSIEYFQEHYPHLSTSPAWAELQGEIFNSKCQHAASGTQKDEKDENDDTVYIRPLPAISSQEKAWRLFAKDYENVYCGHCNTTTDIKEAVFIGRENKFIAAGSDDGNLFIWDRDTTNLVRIIEADNSIVNCVQSHPNICMLATSGIESVIKLWTPRGQDEDEESIQIGASEFEGISKKNQQRMSLDPVEMMVLPMEDISQAFGVRWGDPGGDEDFTHGASNMPCRPS